MLIICMDTLGCNFSELKYFNLFNPKDSNDSPLGCFLEVDLDYPNELHDLENDYPLAGEKKEVTEEMLCKYQLKIIKDNNFSLGRNEKLISNLGNKRRYKLHHQNFI